GGRPTPRLNLFATLLRDARDGGGIYVKDKRPGVSPAGLVGYRADMGAKGSKYVSFPHEVFERAILSRLREIDAREILPDSDAAGKVLALTGKLADIEGRVEKVKAQIIEGDGGDDVGLDVLRALERKRATAAAELAEAKREAASPTAAAWGEFGTL